MVNVSASQEDMKKPRLTYLRHIVITLVTVMLTKIEIILVSRTRLHLYQQT